MTREKSTVSDQFGDRPRKTGSPSVGYSNTTHKERANWFQARESWPLRESPVDMLIRERARAAVELPPAAGDQQWASIGPSNIGGRMTSLVCDPTNARRLWAGAAGGGVWHSTDAGLTWAPQWHDEPSLNVGALAIDPQDPNIVYAGTGEANLSADSHPGVGLMRTLDGGATWQLLAPAETSGLPRRIGALAVDPFNPKHILAGGVAHNAGETLGLLASTDGGMSWAEVPVIGNGRYFCHDVRFEPRQQGLIYVTVDARGSKTGIWRSTDGGASWTQRRQGFPPADRFQRTSMAIAPSDPAVLYAQASDSKGAVLGVFCSADGGDTWTSTGGTHFAGERQMTYGNTIVVHPQRPDWVLCGGVDLHLTTDGGKHWRKVTKWNAERGTTGYAHADHHALVMPADQPGWVYDLNDGGLDFSTDGGNIWENRSNGLATNMFYDVEVAQADGDMVAGGAQDNGTLVTLDGQAGTYQELSGGDGGWVVIDPKDPDHLFSTAQHMRIFRLRQTDGWTVVSPPEDDAAKPWMVFLSMDNRDSRVVFTGSTRVWRTRDDGDNWTAVSEVLDGSPVTAVEVARGGSMRVYIGTENGGFYRSTDGGDTWSDNLAGAVLPGLTITRVQSRADDADIVYATVANFGTHHVFRSSDGGLNWADIDHGDLPDAPVQSIALPAAHPERVYICGDAGVFISEDEGASWWNLTRNLPNVIVVDLVYHEDDRTLTAATYGRSIWRLQVD